MQISPIQKNQTANFQGRLKSGILPDMLKNFSEKGKMKAITINDDEKFLRQVSKEVDIKKFALK